MTRWPHAVCCAVKFHLSGAAMMIDGIAAHPNGLRIFNVLAEDGAIVVNPRVLLLASSLGVIVAVLAACAESPGQFSEFEGKLDQRAQDTCLSIFLEVESPFRVARRRGFDCRRDHEDRRE